jgi:hypothetical protein
MSFRRKRRKRKIEADIPDQRREESLASVAAVKFAPMMSVKSRK